MHVCVCRSVNATSIDEYMKEKGMSRVDILKVDAEGYDADVLRGARESLKTSLLAVIFEANPLEREVIQFLDSFGFSCYLAGTRPRFIQLTACLDHDVFRAAFDLEKTLLTLENLESPNKLMGNAYCAHRQRARGLVRLLRNTPLCRQASTTSLSTRRQTGRNE